MSQKREKTMKQMTVLGALILAFSVSAFGQLIDPNLGFCNAPSSASACSGQPDTNPITSSTFGMWSFGSNDASSPWYMLVAVPQTSQTSIAAPTITSSVFGITETANAFFTPTTTGDIYGLFSQTSSLGSNGSMNASNLFGALEQAAFGGKPGDFDVFLYTLTPGFSGATSYSFGSSGLTAGTFLAGIGVGTTQQFSTPFTTTGLVQNTEVPDGGMTLMLLGGALVGVETLRRKLRV